MKDYPLEQRTVRYILEEKAGRIGSKPWLLFGNQTWSYGDLHLLTNRFGNALSSLGIGKGAHVSVMLGNCPEYFGIVWGLGKIGGVAIPLNTAARGELLAYFINQSDSTWLVVAQEWGDRVAEIAPLLPNIKGCIWVGNQPAKDSPLAGLNWELADLRDFESAPTSDPGVDVRYNDPHLIMYTSGTTGPSKGVYSPQSHSFCIGRHLTQQFGYRPDDVLYTCLPLFHGNAFNYCAYPALWSDAALAVSPRFSVSRFWDEIRACGATQFNALGAMISMLLKQPASEKDRQHNVRQCMALPLTKESYRDFSERFGMKITSLYAMTETFPVAIFVPDDPVSKASSAGRNHGYGEMCIMNQQDAVLPPHQVGEICVRPSEPWSMMLGYYKMPEATLREMRNMWFHSGDRGYLDEDGYLYFVDRTKESIRRRGENISAYEVEMLVAKHADVLEVAAVPVASELGEDDVMVYIVLQPGAKPSHAEIIQFCSKNMAYFMVPRYVHFIDALPKTASEKIEKYKLKSYAEENKPKLWDRDAAGIVVSR